jgi:predicted GNAT family acetyltransferase
MSSQNRAMTALTIHHDTEAGRFTTQVDGRQGEATYRLVNGPAGPVMHLVHTGVPAALQGRGVAADLVAAALAEARAQGWRVRPVCSYVRAYMRRHPETQDLLEPA